MNGYKTINEPRITILLSGLLYALLMSGCAKPYIQTPEILGENPAKLILHDKELEDKKYGTKIFSIHKSQVKCNGIGPANKEIISMGRFYDDSGATGAKDTEILIPVDSEIIVLAFYSLTHLFSTELCDIGIKFQPKPSAKYMYFTKREKEGGVFSSAGKCYANIYEILENDESNEEVLVEVESAVYGSMYAFDQQKLFCDGEGNKLTEREWEELKWKDTDSLLYGNDDSPAEE